MLTPDESVESALAIPIKDAGFIVRTYGADCRLRSYDPRFNRPLLYRAELREHNIQRSKVRR